ncbi:hypothetical protein [Flammeovirga sp. EKP202]|uniref:hypothetical protein n=1 Tax=Flammeovirga sp. EKP202 TaxID=2770592 RepID=UPI00165F726F|nr:hypothetical protein [Flammeovirga sp. EKP202]MBD0402914.1 hypothetical protein [Flammeovirga sp. EKP202]
MGKLRKPYFIDRYNAQHEINKAESQLQFYRHAESVLNKLFDGFKFDWSWIFSIPNSNKLASELIKIGCAEIIESSKLMPDAYVQMCDIKEEVFNLAKDIVANKNSRSFSELTLKEGVFTRLSDAEILEKYTYRPQSDSEEEFIKDLHTIRDIYVKYGMEKFIGNSGREFLENFTINSPTNIEDHPDLFIPNPATIKDGVREGRLHLIFSTY